MRNKASLGFYSLLIHLSSQAGIDLLPHGRHHLFSEGDETHVDLEVSQAAVRVVDHDLVGCPETSHLLVIEHVSVEELEMCQIVWQLR